MILGQIKRFFLRPKSSVPTAAGLTMENPYQDIDPDDMQRVEAVSAYTMTSIERRYHLLQALRYVVRNEIDGAIVECGVWRGGSMMLAALTLMELSAANRELYLFDTFEGMPPPGENDVHPTGRSAEAVLALDSGRKHASHVWAIASEHDVRENISSTGYPKALVHFVRGRVEDTIPQAAPRSISLLRLDTDWYESTKHELEHLYSRVARGGVIIVDDYGWWKGSRKATDEFIARCKDPILLNRLDSGGGRSFIKIG